MKTRVVSILFLSLLTLASLLSAGDNAKTKRTILVGAVAHSTSGSVVARSTGIPVDRVPYVDISTWIIPGEGTVVQATVFMSFVPPAPVSGWVEMDGEQGPTMVGSPAVVRLEKKGTSSSLDPFFLGEEVQPLYLPLALAHEAGFASFVVNIPYTSEVYFQAAGDVELRGFEFYVETCKEDNVARVTWHGFSMSPNVPGTATVSVGNREKEFPTTLHAPGIWGVGVSGFNAEFYEEVFVAPDGVATSITLDGERVEYWWYFPTFSDLPPCDEEGYEGGKG